MARGWESLDVRRAGTETFGSLHMHHCKTEPGALLRLRTEWHLTEREHSESCSVPPLFVVMKAEIHSETQPFNYFYHAAS